MTYREEYLSAHDGLQLYYRDYGDAASLRPPVLCLCGLTRNTGDFDRLARRLSTERRVVCMDYRGRGRSDYDPDWRNYTPEACVSDVMQVIFALNLHRLVVVGTSYGGLLGMGLAVYLPTVLAGLVVNDTGPELNPAGIDRIMTYVGRDNPQTDWAAADAKLRETFPHLHLRSEEDWNQMVRGTFREGDDGMLHHDWDPRIAKPFLESPTVRELWPYYRALRHLPVLAIRGGESDVLSEAAFDRMAQEKPDLTRITVDGVGHTPTLQEPECRSAIDDFLERIDG